MLKGRERPREVTTDLAAPLLRVVDELLPDVLHDTTQYANNRIECGHGRLKARLRPMRGLRTDRSASTVIRGHAFVQNLRRGHYELGVEARHERLRVAAAFDELTSAV
jgi:transposase-like protein